MCVDKLVGMVVNKIDAYDDNADDVVRECWWAGKYYHFYPQLHQP